MGGPKSRRAVCFKRSPASAAPCSAFIYPSSQLSPAQQTTNLHRTDAHDRFTTARTLHGLDSPPPSVVTSSRLLPTRIRPDRIWRVTGMYRKPMQDSVFTVADEDAQKLSLSVSREIWHSVLPATVRSTETGQPITAVLNWSWRYGDLRRCRGSIPASSSRLLTPVFAIARRIWCSTVATETKSRLAHLATGQPLTDQHEDFAFAGAQSPAGCSVGRRSSAVTTIAWGPDKRWQHCRFPTAPLYGGEPSVERTSVINPVAVARHRVADDVERRHPSEAGSYARG